MLAQLSAEAKKRAEPKELRWDKSTKRSRTSKELWPRLRRTLRSAKCGLAEADRQLAEAKDEAAARKTELHRFREARQKVWGKRNTAQIIGALADGSGAACSLAAALPAGFVESETVAKELADMQKRGIALVKAGKEHAARNAAADVPKADVGPQLAATEDIEIPDAELHDLLADLGALDKSVGPSAKRCKLLEALRRGVCRKRDEAKAEGHHRPSCGAAPAAAPAPAFTPAAASAGSSGAPPAAAVASKQSV